MYFDVVFIVSDSNKYFDRNTMEKQALGGMESSVVRVAEGLGSLGLSVAVVEGGVPNFETTMGQFCFFLHSDSIPEISCRHFIQVRNNNNSHLFPESKHYIWMHNTAKEDWKLDKKVTVIGVSRWHRNQIRDVTDNGNIKYIYNPLSEDLFSMERIPHDPNLLIWASSPHKGLGKALEIYKILKKRNDKFQLCIFNPGYFQLDTVNLSTIPGVSVYGMMSSRQMWSLMRKALCVLYPSDYPETMCLVAAEANALGTPVATYSRGALKEVVSSSNQMVEPGNESGLMDKIMEWQKGSRPVVSGREEFKFSGVIMKWCKLLAQGLEVK